MSAVNSFCQKLVSCSYVTARRRLPSRKAYAMEAIVLSSHDVAELDFSRLKWLRQQSQLVEL